jgi:PRC-barrel domain
MTRQPSRLRYVDAGQLDSRVLNLGGLDVRNERDEHIGDVEGLLIDSVSGRPRYLVVDSGGWFRSRTFLLPVAHARLDESRRALRADIDKDTINRFPQMRSDRYDAFADDELQRYDEGVWRARGLTQSSSAVGTPGYDTTMIWWDSAAWASTPVPGTPSVSARHPGAVREEILARSEDPVRARAERERMLAHERSRDSEGRAPAAGERAQPGDVLGIESGGETTAIGDTAEDEDRRRERAERDIRDVHIESREDRRRRE